MKTAYLYIRVSTDEQKRKGYSLPEQEDRLLKYCHYNGIAVKGIFREDHSAKNFNRPEWKKLIALIKAQKAKEDNNILFVKWDRFSRNIGYAYEMIGLLREYNTTVAAIDQPIDFSIPENTVIFSIYLSMSEAENERRGLNTANGIRRAKQMGRYPNKAPLGYTNSADLDGRKRIVPKQPEADIVKWAFQLLSKNLYRVEEVRKMVNAKGVQCSRANFWKLIRNPVYCGFVRLKSSLEEVQLIKGLHEAIIPENLFDEVQDIVNTKKRLVGQRTDSNDLFPLKRYLICPVCGRKLCGSYSQGRHKKYPYYHCSSKCKIRFKADAVNNVYKNKLKHLALSPKAVELFSLILDDININIRKIDYLSERQLLLKQMDEQKLFIAKARKLFVTDVLKYDDYREIKKEHGTSTGYLQKELDTVINKLKSIDRQSKFANRPITQIFQKFSNLDIADKKHIINHIQPSSIDTYTGDFSLILNKTLSKILIQKESKYFQIKETIYTPRNFKDKGVSIKRAVAILAKNEIEVDDEEASTILNFLYQIATAYNSLDDSESASTFNEKSNRRKSA
ncbi:recombinase family protein [Mucilaginibacter sp. Mucisp84]|uniref:recombinase family protein n=1 Tax=Mucilaginibacter sp. Mucisp84 TaxID=3243058 RepID=UPI0039A5C009